MTAFVKTNAVFYHCYPLRPIAPGVVVSVLGRLGSVLLQPSVAGDIGFVPLPDVSTNKLVISLLNFNQQSDRYRLKVKHLHRTSEFSLILIAISRLHSAEFLPVTTTVVDAKDLVNGKKKVEVDSDENKYTMAISTKLSYV